MSEQSVLNLCCPICKLVFKNVDTIYSTSCGHIFHFTCLYSSRAQSTSCPQCRSYNPTTHRVFLNFDEVEKNTDFVALVEYQKKITDLETDVEGKRILFQKLRSDFDKFRKSSECRDKGLQELVTLQKMENQKLQNLLNDANEMIERKQEKVEQLLKENMELTSDLESRDEGASETILISKNKVLEQRLKLITAELEKEIIKNTELSIERLKHQSYKDLMQTQHAQPKQLNPKPKNKPRPTASKTIAIKNVPLDKVECPLESIVVSLAQKMNIELRKDQIKIVDKEMNPIEDKMTLWVQFKDEASKLHFLMCKDLLKNNDGLKSLEISEFNADFLRPLFNYANTKLRGKVFKYIAMKPNTIIAKKNLYDTEEIVIKSRSHVDDLLKNA